MGQASSTNQQNDSKSGAHANLTKTEIYNLFYTRCLSVLKPSELAFIKSVVDDEKETKIVSRSKLQAQLAKEDSSDSKNVDKVMDILFPLMKRMGQSPFLNDNLEAVEELTIHEFVIAFTFISRRYVKIFGQDFDFLGLLFTSLSTNKQTSNEVGNVKGTEDQSIEMPLLLPFEDSDEMNLKSRKVDWKNAPILAKLEKIATESTLEATSFIAVTTLVLIAKSIPLQKQSSMEDQFFLRVRQWNEFESYAMSILKFINVNLQTTMLQEVTISYPEFSQGVAELIPNFYQDGMKRLANELFVTLKPVEANEKESDETAIQKKHLPFESTKLVTPATLAYISSILKGCNNNLEVTTENAVKLYTGAESGFSIRSLETKIFKWQAPTFLIVSGKRIKQKTVDTNRRYQKFNEIYPRYFLKQENHLQPWQHENDKITYCVVIKQPWQSSNKKNFGDESSVILSVSPRADCFKSIHSDVVHGKSIYFNNQGMGLGFGNLQALNKNGHQKYYPGDVSLTIEANLEFAIFRHLAQSTQSNTTNFFHPSSVVGQLGNGGNFEDRFTITDLEVWGIGSMKELDEQRKQWEWEEKQANARQSVNVRSMGEERAFLEMAGLVGNHGSYGS